MFPFLNLMISSACSRGLPFIFFPRIIPNIPHSSIVVSHTVRPISPVILFQEGTLQIYFPWFP